MLEKCNELNQVKTSPLNSSWIEKFQNFHGRNVVFHCSGLLSPLFQSCKNRKCSTFTYKWFLFYGCMSVCNESIAIRAVEMRSRVLVCKNEKCSRKSRPRSFEFHKFPPVDVHEKENKLFYTLTNRERQTSFPSTRAANNKIRW
jgi:hypothetical protein